MADEPTPRPVPYVALEHCPRCGSTRIEYDEDTFTVICTACARTWCATVRFRPQGAPPARKQAEEDTP